MPTTCPTSTEDTNVCCGQAEPIRRISPWPKGRAIYVACQVKAARKNGQQGGRKRNRTLGETLLRRKLNPTDGKAIDEAYMQLTMREQEKFRKYFGLPNNPHLDASDFASPTRKPAPEMQHIFRKFRLVARHLLLRSPAPRPRKPYVIGMSNARPKSRSVGNGSIQPCHALPGRNEFTLRKPSCYRFLDLLLSKNPNRSFTLEDVKANDVGHFSDKVYEAVLDELRFKYPLPQAP